MARKRAHYLFAFAGAFPLDGGRSLEAEESSEVPHASQKSAAHVHIEERGYVREGVGVSVKIENAPVDQLRDPQSPQNHPRPISHQLIARKNAFEIMEDEIGGAGAPAALLDDCPGRRRQPVSEDMHAHRPLRVLQNRQHRNHGVRQIWRVGGEGDLGVRHGGQSVKARRFAPETRNLFGQGDIVKQNSRFGPASSPPSPPCASGRACPPRPAAGTPATPGRRSRIQP